MAVKKYLSLEKLTEYDALLKQHIDESISNVDFIINANASTQIDTGMYMVTLDHTIAEVNAAYEADKKMLLIFKNSDGNYINLNFFAYLNGLYMFTGASASGIMTAYVNESTSFVQESSVQDKIVGTSGQIVGFDGNGNPVAQDIPVIPIDKGGTNATTVEAARTNLDVYSKAEIDEVLAPITEPLVVTVTIGNPVEGSNFVFDATPDKPLADVVSALDNGRPVYITDSYGLKYKVINWTDTAYIIESTSVNQYGEIVSTSMQIDDGVGYYMYSSALGKEELHGLVTELETAINAKASSDYVEGMESTLQAAIDGKVPVTRKINNKELSADISLTAVDVGADPVNSASNALTSAQTYTDQKIAALINSAPTTLDTLGEIATAMQENENVVDALNDAIGTKADKVHNHAISDVTNLQSTLDAKATQTSLDTHTSNTTVHITSTERTNWNTAKTHADSAHAPSNAEANQNAFSNIVVGSTTIAADQKTDSLTLAGSNVTITPDASADKVTIGITKANVEAALGFTPQSSGNYAAANHNHNDVYYTETEIDTKLEGKANATHSHSNASTSADGFMTAAMVQKLEGIQAGATNVTVDANLSASSTNPVQNKAVNTALTNAVSAISANTSSINSHSTAISNLQTAVSEIQEITSSEISALFAN